MNRPSPLLLLALLAAALFVIPACPPPSGELDDDDVTSPDDDDDTSDDDDATAPPDDDDFTIPPGTGLGGVISYQLTDGALPPGAVRVGMMFGGGADLLPAEERWSALVSEEGLSGGDSIYTVYVEGEPPSDDFSPMGPFADFALYYLFAYVDDDSSEDYSVGDPILGSSETLLVYLLFEGDTPDELVAWGGGLGWNVVEYDDIVDEDPDLDLTHTPDGTNSASGPEIDVALLPHLAGEIGVTTDVLMPTGSVVAGIHTSAFGGTPVPDFEVFTQSAVNFELRGGEDLVDWAISGAPPASHLGPLGGDGDDDDDDGLGVDAAVYAVIGYYDDGDLQFSVGGCDTVLAGGEDRYLMWIEPGSLNLPTAFYAQYTGIPMGWVLFDEALGAWRLFATGVNLIPFEPGGDDDDSSEARGGGDDDDSAGGWPDFGIPPECLPSPGDDDDSAGDDDDSAAPVPG